jgi:hypothetical protein
MVVVPADTAVANPFEPPALLIVATPVVDELQVTIVVRSWVLLSEKVPVATSCCAVPYAIEGFTGVTAIDVTVADVTVKIADFVLPPNAADIVVVPAETGVASPFEPAALLIVATPVLDELQVADEVRFWVLSLEKVPVTENCCDVPFAILGLAGFTAIDVSVAARASTLTLLPHEKSRHRKATEITEMSNFVPYKNKYFFTLISYPLPYYQWFINYGLTASNAPISKPPP